MKIKSGIYCIMNTVNEKKYIGSSTNINKRWETHRYDLNRGIHSNIHLQHAWNNYGKEKFIFYILEEKGVEHRKELFILEDEYILKYESLNPDKGYNKELAGNRVTSSPDSKVKLREVVVLDKQGNFIKEYISIAEVERDLEISAKKIDYLLNNRTTGKKRKSYKGYQFIYKDNYDPSKNYQWEYQGRSIPVVQLDDEFNVIDTFKNVRDTAQKLNLHEGSLATAILRKHKCGGFHFRRYREDGIYQRSEKRRTPSKPVVVDGEEFQSTREAMVHYGIDLNKYKYVKTCIRKEIKIYGRTWKFQ